MQKSLFLLSWVVSGVLLTTAAASAQAVYRTMESNALASDKVNSFADSTLLQAIDVIQQKQFRNTKRQFTSGKQRRHTTNMITGGSEAFPM